MLSTQLSYFYFASDIAKILMAIHESQIRRGKMKDDFVNNQGKIVKREHPREEIIIDVLYRVLSPLKDVGLTQNISQGGLCLLLNNELPPGTILELKYRLPHEEARQIVTSVEVMWQKKTERGFLTGVRFN